MSTPDLPPECALTPLPCSTHSSPLCEESNEYLEVDEILTRDMIRTIIEAPTGSGNSRKCPNVIIEYLNRRGYRKPLLVLSSATIDVVGVQEACSTVRDISSEEGDTVESHQGVDVYMHR